MKTYFIQSGSKPEKPYFAATDEFRERMAKHYKNARVMQDPQVRSESISTGKKDNGTNWF